MKVDEIAAHAPVRPLTQSVSFGGQVSHGGRQPRAGAANQMLSGDKPSLSADIHSSIDGALPRIEGRSEAQMCAEICRCSRELSGPYRAMRAAMRCERRFVLYMEMAMRCDAKIVAIRVLVAEILCDALPCENTSDAMPRCWPLSSGMRYREKTQETLRKPQFIICPLGVCSITRVPKSARARPHRQKAL